MDEEPPSSVHELSITRCSEVSITVLSSLHLNFAGRKEPDTRMRLVSNANSSLDGVRIEFAVSAEILEKSAVWSTHSQLNVGKLLCSAEKADLILGQHEGTSNSLMVKHIYYNYNL